MDAMLGKLLRKLVTLPGDMLGSLCDLLEKLENDEWRSAFKRFLRKEPCWVKGLMAVIKIDRSRPFDPAKFQGLGKGWTIWKGPADGNGLEGEEEQDNRSLVLAEIDLSKVELVTHLKEGETYITGEERLKRLKKSGHICLDAAAFAHLWANQHLIPEWKGKAVFFDGTILRNSYGPRCALYLYWHGETWYWNVHWLGHNRNADYPSLVLA